MLSFEPGERIFPLGTDKNLKGLQLLLQALEPFRNICFMGDLIYIPNICPCGL